MPKTKRYKTYPFPYLADFSKDYCKTQFNLEVNFKPCKDKIEISANYTIDNEGILSLIKSKLLKVILKTTCNAMGYSKTQKFQSDATSIKFNIDSQDVEGDVDFNAYLIANQDFTMQSNDDFSKFWQSETPSVKENNVLGESNERTINMRHIPSGTKKSIFKFTSKISKEDTAPFNLVLDNSDTIVFEVSKRMKLMVDSIAKHEQTKQYIISLFITPALTDILRRMININYPESNDFNQKYSDYRWYRVLVENYRKSFKDADPTDPSQALEPLEAAQTIIEKLNIWNSVAKIRRLKE